MNPQLPAGTKRSRGRPKGSTGKPKAASPRLDIFFNWLAESYGIADNASDANNRTIEALFNTLFPKQRQVIDDPSRWKSVLTPRRAGKSYMAMVYAHIVALRKNGARVIIVNLTLKSGRNVFWKDVQKLHAQFGIGAEYHHTEMRITLDNGSLIQFVGADTRAEIEKLRGGSYDLIIVDECKSFSPMLLIELIQDVAKPALSDRRGSMVLIGTPGNILNGPFYEATYPGYMDPEAQKPTSRTFDNPEAYWLANPSEPYRWSRHTWTVNDNVSAPHLMKDALLEKEREGWDDEHPTWLREYQGQWVAAETSFVYAYPILAQSDPTRVQWTPKFNSGSERNGLEQGNWRYILGLDLGFEDDFAMVVVAYNTNDKVLYHVWDYKEKHQDVDQIADHVNGAVKRFGNFDAMVADTISMGKTVIETLNRRYGYYIQAAEKREKYDYIELVNADFRTGRVKIQPQTDLELELLNLQWDLSHGAKEYLARTGKLKEHPGLPNHLCDAFLYAWRFSYHYYSGRYQRPQPQAGSAAFWSEWEKQSFQKLIESKTVTEEDNSGLPRDYSSKSRDPLSDYYKN